MRVFSKSLIGPQSPDEAADYIRRVQELDQKIQQIELELSQAVNRLTAEAEEKAVPLYHLREVLVQGVEMYATTHRDEILPPNAGKKSLRVPCGRFGWRMGNWCVQIEDEDALVAELESRGLSHYVSDKKVVNRTMLIKDRKKLERLKIPGLAFERGERFFVETNKPVAKTEVPA